MIWLSLFFHCLTALAAVGGRHHHAHDQANSIGQRGNTTYIILASAHEGFSEWSYILSDLVFLSSQLSMSLADIVFVEPCFLNGRITGCDEELSIGVSSVYDFERL